MLPLLRHPSLYVATNATEPSSMKMMKMFLTLPYADRILGTLTTPFRVIQDATCQPFLFRLERHGFYPIPNDFNCFPTISLRPPPKRLPCRLSKRLFNCSCIVLSIYIPIISPWGTGILPSSTAPFPLSTDKTSATEHLLLPLPKPPYVQTPPTFSS